MKLIRLALLALLSWATPLMPAAAPAIVSAVVGVATLAASAPAQADVYVRQSTASQTFEIGPYISDTDFKTRQAALTIANTDIKLQKFGSGSEVSKNSGGGTHVAQGRYSITLDATDTNTVGTMRLGSDVATALPVWEYIQVLSAADYDFRFGSTALPVNVTALNGTTTACSGGSIPLWQIIDCGTAQAVSSSTIQLRAAANFDTNDEIAGATVYILTATTGAGQSRVIASYVNSTDTATLRSNWTTTPTGTVTYAVVPTPANNFDTAAQYITDIHGGWDVANVRWNATSVSQVPTNSQTRTSTTTSLASTSTLIDSTLVAADHVLKGWRGSITSGTNSDSPFRVCDNSLSAHSITFCEALPAAVASGVTYDLTKDAPTILAGITHTNATVPTVGIANSLGATAISGVMGFALPEPTATPAWNDPAYKWLAWIGAQTRNKLTQTGSGGTGTKCLRNDADNANIACSTVTDDGTTLTVGKPAP